MNLNEYERTHFQLYARFAQTVLEIVQKTLSANQTLRGPQSIQARAKSPGSLRDRLTEIESLDSESIEVIRRDLAGVRVIFYTNNDVDKFLQSGVIAENFEIEKDSTKIHHPRAENEGTRYRGIHYTVRLRRERANLPEYAEFAGLRCEIQIQTILNHAWSETSHDILYKHKLPDGFGKRAIEGVTRRFERIMDNYLVAAGYEIQKAQDEYERVLKGKALFDKDIVRSLDQARDNNERYEILSTLKDFAIPNFDDPGALYEELRGPLFKAVRAARSMSPTPIETPFGRLDGFKADAIAGLVVEIAVSLRLVDPVNSFQLLADTFRDEQNNGVRAEILRAVENLAEHNIGIYEQVGPALQAALVDHLESFSAEEIEGIRPIALRVWEKVLESDIRDAEWSPKSVVLSTGAVPVSDQLVAVREKSLAALFALFDKSLDDPSKREVISALDTSGRPPTHGTASMELKLLLLGDAKKVVEHMTKALGGLSYSILQHIEHGYFYDYRRVPQALAREPNDPVEIAERALASAIVEFRDRANSNSEFVKYKVLVGYESVFPEHWDAGEVDYEEGAEYRSAKIKSYVQEVSVDNYKGWLDLATKCAQTRSDDLATFPHFGEFISQLAKQKPEIAERFLDEGGPELIRFLGAFLSGLAVSERRDIYERRLHQEAELKRNLTGVIRHLRYSDERHPDVARAILYVALGTGDSTTVAECLLFGIQHYDAKRIGNSPEEFVGDALAFLNSRGDSSWIFSYWSAQKSSDFFESAPASVLEKVEQSLEFLPKVSHQADRILSHLAKRDAARVWDYFGRRIARVEKREVPEDFEISPYRFIGLEKVLAARPELALAKGLVWFSAAPNMYQFRGGRLLSSVFVDPGADFLAELTKLVQEGGGTEAKFALSILANYQGSAKILPLLRQILIHSSAEPGILGRVRSCVESTGVVHGERGFADAWRMRKEALAPWANDEIESVRTFAIEEIRALDQMIAADESRAEEEARLRELEFGAHEGEREPPSSGLL